jgi:hypothetical protein
MTRATASMIRDPWVVVRNADVHRAPRGLALTKKSLFEFEQAFCSVWGSPAGQRHRKDKPLAVWTRARGGLLTVPKPSKPAPPRGAQCAAHDHAGGDKRAPRARPTIHRSSSACTTSVAMESRSSPRASLLQRLYVAGTRFEGLVEFFDAPPLCVTTNDRQGLGSRHSHQAPSASPVA